MYIVRLFDIELIQKLVHEKRDLKLTEAVSMAAASRQSSPKGNLHTEIMKILLSSGVHHPDNQTRCGSKFFAI